MPAEKMREQIYKGRDFSKDYKQVLIETSRLIDAKKQRKKISRKQRLILIASIVPSAYTAAELSALLHISRSCIYSTIHRFLEL